MNFSGTDEEFDGVDNILGYHAGLLVDFNIQDNLAFETGLLLNTKGFKVGFSLFGEEFEGKARLQYLDVPLKLKYRHAVGDSLQVLGLFGPVVSYGMSGKLKSTSTYGGMTITEEEDVSFGNEEGDIKRMDAGLDFGLGLAYKKFEFTANYYIGMINTIPEADDDESAKHQVWRFSLAYRFVE